jgi:GTPase
MTRAGFVGLAGRPNVGKSTLVNAIVGAKVAIVSDRPQTTRRAIRGIATDRPAGWQMILVDLPGVQRPRDSLTQRMQRRVERELAGADAALLVVDGHQGVGPGDRFIAKVLLGAKHGTPVVCVVNKCDRLRSSQTAAALAAAAELEAVDELFPVSARTGAGLEPLTLHLASMLPEGPFAYSPEDRSDLPSEVHLAELVREQVLRRTREEIPHSVEVAVEEVERRQGAEGRDALVEVRAQIWVETQSQKGILVGKGGRMVREIGTAARKELERDLGAQVFLDLQVKVREHWRRDDALLDRIGIQ